MARSHRPFLVIGSGRCGTGYAAKLLTALGYDCGHEKAFDWPTCLQGTWRAEFARRRCDSSWLALPFLDQLPADTVVLHQLRHPVKVVRSLVGIDFMGAEARANDPYTKLAEAYVGAPADDVEACMHFWVEWNRRVPQQAGTRPGMRYRLEDLDASLVRQLVALIEPTRELTDDEVAAAFAAVPTNYNHRPRASDVTWATLPEGELKEAIAALAVEYGYDVEREDVGAATASAASTEGTTQASTTPLVPATATAASPLTASSADGDAPDVSVIVPTFNRPELLARALESVRAQRLPAECIEAIVVNDGGASPREVVDAARSAGLDVRLIEHDRNRGRSATKNSGIAAARGRWLCFLDDDDLLHSSHLEVLVAAAAQHAGSGAPVAVYSDALMVHEDDAGNAVSRSMPQTPVGFRPHMLQVANYIPILCVLAPREQVIEAGCFDEQFEALEDWELWLRLARLCSFHHVAEVTCEYRRRASGRDNSTTLELHRHVTTVQEVYAKHPLPVGSPLEQQRAMHLRASLQRAGEFPFEHSVLVTSDGDGQALLEVLQTVVDELRDASFEVVIHAPDSEEIAEVRSMLEGDVTFVYGSDVPADAVWEILERRACGRQRRRLEARRAANAA